MKLYRAVIRPIMSFSAKLQSDTFFGAFCWSYRYKYGVESLLKLIKETKDGQPPVIFSNAFPADTLPLPLGIHDTNIDFSKLEESKAEMKKAFQERKKYKNARFVKKEWFFKIINGNCAGFTKVLCDDSVKETAVIHNMVSRSDETVRKIEESGCLFEENEIFVEKDHKYDLYILSSLDEDVLKQVLILMLTLGIGKNKSSGKGGFELIDWKTAMIPKPSKTNAFVALSNFVPAASDPHRGWYRTFVKYGKLDREYAVAEIPFKKPILFMQAGAVFCTDEVAPFYGRCLDQISVQKNVIVNAYTIAVPAYLEIDDFCS